MKAPATAAVGAVAAGAVAYRCCSNLQPEPEPEPEPTAERVVGGGEAEIAAGPGGVAAALRCVHAAEQGQAQGHALRQLWDECGGGGERARLPSEAEIQRALRGLSTERGDALLASQQLAVSAAFARREEGAFLLKATGGAAGKQLAVLVVGHRQPLSRAAQDHWAERAAFLRGVRSRHVLGILDCGELGDRSGVWIVAPWVRRRTTLADAMCHRRPALSPRGRPSRPASASRGVDEELCSSVALGVARGLAVIHERGFTLCGELDEHSILVEYQAEDTVAVIGDVTGARKQQLGGQAQVGKDLTRLGRLMRKMAQWRDEEEEGQRAAEGWSEPWPTSRNERVSRMYQVIAEQLQGRTWPTAAEQEQEEDRLGAEGWSALHVRNVLGLSISHRPGPEVGLGASDRTGSGAQHAHEALLCSLFRVQFDRIPFDTLQMQQHKLGEGAFGVVFLGRWHGQPVAVKSVHFGHRWVDVIAVDNSDEPALHDSAEPARPRQRSGFTQPKSHVLRRNTWEAFRREIEFAESFRHPNIIACFGTAFGVPPGQEVASAMIVMEFAANGSLFAFLGRLAKAPAAAAAEAVPAQEAAGQVVAAKLMDDAQGTALPVVSGTRRRSAGPLGWDRRRRMVSQIASGMQFLHEQRVTHRDLKSLNVLVSRDYTCKVSDFGQSASDAHAGGSGGLYGTACWNAPEYGEEIGDDAAGRSVCFFKADVWSFGVVCWEIMTLRRPQAEYERQRPTTRTHPQLLLALLAQGDLQLALSEAEREAAEGSGEDGRVLQEVLRGTLVREPEGRLTFGQVVAVLGANKTQ